MPLRAKNALGRAGTAGSEAWKASPTPLATEKTSERLSEDRLLLSGISGVSGYGKYSLRPQYCLASCACGQIWTDRFRWSGMEIC